LVAGSPRGEWRLGFGGREEGVPVDYKLELIVLPVSDVDRAKEFYGERCGFNVDVDTGERNGMRVQERPADV
jgi:hypothetical protein